MIRGCCRRFCTIAWSARLVQQSGQDGRLDEAVAGVTLREGDVVCKAAASVVDVDVVLATAECQEHVISGCSLIHRKLDALLQVIDHELRVPLLRVDAHEDHLLEAVAHELLPQLLQVGSLVHT